jgi:hypothetical protein
VFLMSFSKNRQPYCLGARDILMNDDVRDALAELCKDKRLRTCLCRFKTRSRLREVKRGFHTAADGPGSRA